MAVPIWIVTTEESILFVPVDNSVERTDDLGRRSISEVLAVEFAAAPPTKDMLFGVLSKLYRIVETLTKLVRLGGITTGMDAELSNSSRVPWLLLGNLKGSLSSVERCWSC